MKTISVEPNQDSLLFKGVLTFDTSPIALDKVRKLFPKQGNVILDFGGVTRSDSSALALITELLRQTKDSKLSLKVKNIPKKMMDLARVSGLDGIIPFHEV